MEFGVDPDGLRDGSVTFGKAARELEHVEIGASLEPLAAAFPGGTTAAQVPHLARVWDERLGEVHLRVARSGARLGLAGESYDVVEQEAGHSLSGEPGRA